MSNARSPREVCSTTIGISGISSTSPYVPGVHSFAGSAGCSCPGVQMLSRASCKFRCDRLHFGGDAVERPLQPQVVANAVGAALGDELLDLLLGLAAGAQLLANLVVRRPARPSLSATASRISSRATESDASA